jgi:hypothetical protein
MYLGHGAEHVRLVLNNMREINLISAAIKDRPGKMQEFTKNVGVRTRLAIEPDGSRVLLLLATANNSLLPPRLRVSMVH